MMATEKSGSNGKKKRKGGTRKESPRRALEVQADRAEAFQDALREAVDQIEEGNFDNAITALADAEHVWNGLSATLLQNVVIELKAAEKDTQKIVNRINR